jgi:ParB family chromosome partitioning protein
METFSAPRHAQQDSLFALDEMPPPFSRDDSPKKVKPKQNKPLTEKSLVGQVLMLNIDSIAQNPMQPRKSFDEETIGELAESIRANGMIYPVIVRKNPAPSEVGYVIISGERRWRACKLLGMKDIMAMVVDAPDEQLLCLMLACKTARENLRHFETYNAIMAIEGRFKNRTALAKALGISRNSLYRYFAFAAMPGFILSDLAENPRLLSNKSAGLIEPVLTSFGQLAIEVLHNNIWPRVKSGKLSQSKIADEIKAAINRMNNLPTDRTMRHIFVGDRKVGTISMDANHLAIKLDRLLVPGDKIDAVIQFVDGQICQIETIEMNSSSDSNLS